MANDVLARLQVQFDANTAKFGAALNNLNGQLNTFGATVRKQEGAIARFEGTVRRIQGSLGSLGVAFGAFQVITIFKNAVNSIAEFEQQLSTVRAVTGATGEQFELLRNDALRLGAATLFTAKQVAELQTELGRLGFTPQEIVDATEAIVNLSIATGEDLAKSADTAGSTVRAFGLDAAEATRVVDVMASSFNKSALNLERFQESMKYVAPIARAANLSLEETTALLSILADNGIRGSQAGTSLRRIIGDLAKDGRPLIDRLQELSDKGLDLQGSFDEVGRIAQTSLLVLSKNTDRIRDLSSAYDNAAGSGKRAADIMQDNLTGSITRLSSAYDGLIQGQNEVTESIRPVIDALTNLIVVLQKAGGAVSAYVKQLFIVPRTTAKVFNGLVELFSFDEKKANLPINQVRQFIVELEKQIKISKAAGESTELYEENLRQLEEAYEDQLTAIRKLEKENFTGPEPFVEDYGFLAIFIQKSNEALENQVGILGDLEEKAKKLGEQIKAATSVSEIRRIQRELEGVRIQIDKITNPTVTRSIADILSDIEPLKLPVEIDIQSIEESFKNLQINNELSRFNPEGIVVPIQIDIPEEETEKFDNFVDNLKANIELAAEQISSIFKGGIADAISGFAKDLGNVAAGVGNFGENILKSVASFAEQFGQLLIAAGLAKIAFDRLVISGPAAIAAGIALIAAAQAVSSHLSKSSGGGAGSSSASQASQATRVGVPQSSTTSQDIRISVDQTVIRGQDIWLSFKAVEQSNHFTRSTNG